MKLLIILFLYVPILGYSQIWTSVPGPAYHQLSDIHLLDPTTGYFAGQGGVVFKTTNGGNNWTILYCGVSETVYSVYFVNSLEGYITTGSPSGIPPYRIGKTTDGGLTWTLQTITNASFLFDLHFINDSTGVCVGGSGKIYRTTDSGANWNLIPSNVGHNLRDIFFLNQDTGFIVGEAFINSVVLKTVDGGLNWNTYQAGTSEVMLDIAFNTDSIGFAVGANGTIVKTTDGGVTWTPIVSPTTEFLQAIAFSDPANGYIAGGNGVMLTTTDSGNTWSTQYIQTFSSLFGWYGLEFYGNHGYVSGAEGKVSRLSCINFISNPQTSCDSFYWAVTGNSYDSSGFYSALVPNAAGCDSNVTLDLTINKSDYLTQTANSCDSYTWLVNGNTYTASGLYTTVLTNSAGCDSNITLDLTLNVSTNSFHSVTDCQSYTWKATGNTYFSSGTYSTVIPNSAGCDSTLTLNLSIDTLDTAISVNNFTLNASQASSYQWVDCLTKQPITGQTGQTFTPSNNGSFGVILTNGVCYDTTACYSIMGIGIKEHKENEVKIFPNPSEGKLWIKIPTGSTLLGLTLLDSKGALVSKLPVLSNQTQEQVLPLHISDPGLYFLHFQFSEFSLTEPVLVE